MWTPGDRERVGDYGCGRSLSDEQWKIIEPFIPPEKPGGRHRDVDIRAVLNALFYVVRTGCQWRHLPPPPLFPPSSTVYGYFRRFIDEGVGNDPSSSGDGGSRAGRSGSQSNRRDH